MSYFSWAPVFNSYGSNNRTNSVRVPMGGGRCESRNADGAVNPYLAATLALAAGLEGVREKIDPGAPNDDNLYTTRRRRAEKPQHRLPAADLAGGRGGVRRRSVDREDPREGAAAMNSSNTRLPNGRSTIFRSARGRSSATATCSRS